VVSFIETNAFSELLIRRFMIIIQQTLHLKSWRWYSMNFKQGSLGRTVRKKMIWFRVIAGFLSVLGLHYAVAVSALHQLMNRSALILAIFRKAYVLHLRRLSSSLSIDYGGGCAGSRLETKRA
jgi:hypothetical protein